MKLLLRFSLLLLVFAFALSAQNGPCENGIMQCADGTWMACADGCPVLNCPGDCGCPGRSGTPGCPINPNARLNFTPLRWVARDFTPVDRVANLFSRSPLQRVEPVIALNGAALLVEGAAPFVRLGPISGLFSQIPLIAFPGEARTLQGVPNPLDERALNVRDELGTIMLAAESVLKETSRNDSRWARIHAIEAAALRIARLLDLAGDKTGAAGGS